jgi:hypothetical protein
MPPTEGQKGRARAELALVTGQLGRVAPVERQKLIREALERAGVTLTWDEWDTLEPELLGGAPDAGRPI